MLQIPHRTKIISHPEIPHLIYRQETTKGAANAAPFVTTPLPHPYHIA